MSIVKLKLTTQEVNVVHYLSGKSHVNWEDLAQFAKDPQTVKLKTLQKVVSDVKKKYKDVGSPCPFECTFGSLVATKATVIPTSEVYKKLGDPDTWVEEETEYQKKFVTSPQNILEFQQETLSMIPQHLVKIRPPKAQPAKGISVPEKPAVPVELPAHRDFKLEKNYRRVRTKNNVAELREQEWEIFYHLYENAEKMVTLEDFKNLIWKNWGSKTPPSWAESISRSLTALRKSIPELKLQNRLLTITGQTTAYMLR